jgi:CRISPR type I-E-associated protein CasA/Cse1/CRISPR type I-E-associated protein CasB/Cse2
MADISLVPPLVPLLWGKSGEADPLEPTPDAWHPLVFHMVNSMHIAEQIWEHYLSNAVRSALGPAEVGKSLFMWLAGLHDIGKATPNFQRQSARHYKRVAECVPHSGEDSGAFRHELLSARLVTLLLTEEGWPPEAAQWVANVVGSHHGTFPTSAELYRPKRHVLGPRAYAEAQHFLFNLVTQVSGVNAAEVRTHVPGLGAQMAISGAVVMSDWLASNRDYFPYDTASANDKPSLDEYVKESQKLAKERFHHIAQLGDVWRPHAGNSAKDVYWRRFGIETPRNIQVQVDTVARQVECPGLMVVEAPMGEGKTEAGLAAAEVLADRFGHNGLFYALPTQATTNSFFDRTLEAWADTHERKPTVALVHGTARINEEYTDLALGGIGEGAHHALTASSWMRGSKKALLTPVAIGTIDQLLFVGVSARYVQLRHFGLANKVVIIDEVNAYDTYMSKILHRTLHWLGWHSVPVILLSATLPQKQREALLRAYSGASEVAVQGTGNPRITWVDSPTLEQRQAWVEDEDEVLVTRSYPVRTERSSNVQIEFAPERANGDLRALIEEELDGIQKGNILVLRNTVRRAQDTYTQLIEQFQDFAVYLAHTRFTAKDRERIDGDLVRRYGPPDRAGERPLRSIVVATQVAEQLLDIDFDLVISDLAPIDLLLQRAGRCHRHQGRPQSVRGALTAPKLIITGYHDTGDGPPGMVSKRTRHPYEHHLLYRTMAVLTHPERRRTIRVPDDVPTLVESVYADTELGPKTWQSEMAAARQEAEIHRMELDSEVRTALIEAPDPFQPSLNRVHPFGNDHEIPESEEKAAHMLPVRHEAGSLEVILLRRTTAANAVTVSQTSEGLITVPIDRVPSSDLIRTIGDQTIRLPRWQLGAPPPTCPQSWEKTRWANRLRVLLLEPNGSKRQKNTEYYYSPEKGWTPKAQDSNKVHRFSLKFNLMDDPWLPYIDIEGKQGTGSIRHVLTNAHTIRDVTVDVPTQYPPILRMLLAVLHRALSEKDHKKRSYPRSKDQWKALHHTGCLPKDLIEAYADTWRAFFELFDDQQPFMQVGPKGLTVPEPKSANLLVSYASTGNNAPIFATHRDEIPDPLTPAQAARWLLHVQAWDTAGIKTGAQQDPAARKGKTTGNRTGLLGDLGVLIPTSTTLHETLLFNLLVLDTTLSPSEDLPLWERRPLDATWTTRPPLGLLDLYTWPSRRIRLVPEILDGRTVVRRALVCAGDRLDLSTTNLHAFEPHTAWYQPSPKGSDQPSPALRPRRHRPGQELWRDLDGILGWDQPLASTNEDTKPLVFKQLGSHFRSAADLPTLQLRAYGISYGLQSAVILETYADSLMLPAELLVENTEWGLDKITAKCVANTRGVATALGQFAADLAFAQGGAPATEDARRNEVRQQYYADLDARFRVWIENVNDPERKESYQNEWHAIAYNAALRHERVLLSQAGQSELRSHVGTDRKYWIGTNLNLVTARRVFRARLKSRSGAIAEHAEWTSAVLAASAFRHPIGTGERAELSRILGRLWEKNARMASDAPAALARWRRGLGRRHDETPELSLEIAQVFRTSDRDPSWNAQEAVFQALSLYATHQHSVNARMHVDMKEGHNHSISVGQALRELCVRTAPGRRDPWETDDNRGIVRLMDAVVTSRSIPELVSYLRRTIILLRREKIPLDYARLAREICDWSSQERGLVARRWATDFYRRSLRTQNIDEEN